MGKIDSWIPKIPRLKNAKVSRFSYRNAAYMNDDIEGVENYDYTRDMNVPTLNKTDTDNSVLDSGARSQFSSLSKNALNHFFGRVSYNLNKVIDFLSDFLDDFISLNTRFISFTEIVSFSSSASLENYADGTTKRLLSTADSDITITLPAGETYLGNNTIALAPSIMLTITKRGTEWINSSGNAATADMASKANVRVSLLHSNMWFAKTWTDLTSFDGNQIWTYGENIYYSSGAWQYVLNKATYTWVAKTWTGLTNFYGSQIWTDGDNIYNSYGASQYVLNKTTSTWVVKTWDGLASFDGLGIWTDGDNIYNSYGASQYVLNKTTSTWVVKTWDGLASFDGNQIWTDGENIYLSYGAKHYVLNKTTSTWVAKTWAVLTSFNGLGIWTDGENIYYSYYATHYVLNKTTSTWVAKTWDGLTNFYGNHVWTDGDNIYRSNLTTHNVLPSTRHNYVDDYKYNSLFGTVTECDCRTLSDRFVFRNE